MAPSAFPTPSSVRGQTPRHYQGATCFPAQVLSTPHHLVGTWRIPFVTDVVCFAFPRHSCFPSPAHGPKTQGFFFVLLPNFRANGQKRRWACRVEPTPRSGSGGFKGSSPLYAGTGFRGANNVLSSFPIYSRPANARAQCGVGMQAATHRANRRPAALDRLGGCPARTTVRRPTRCCPCPCPAGCRVIGGPFSRPKAGCETSST